MKDKTERDLVAAKRMLSDDSGFAKRVKDSISSLFSRFRTASRVREASSLTSMIDSEYEKYAEPKGDVIPPRPECTPRQKAIIGKDIELIDDYGNRTRLYKC